jgi:uncharacterized membrane protein YsdA (DUF1294 family)
MIFLFVYLVVINLAAVYVMYSDKKKSKKGYWRIPENRLFLIALLFGSIGILAGMKLFRHKTRHLKFTIGIPAILVAQLFIVYKFLVWFSY